MIVTKKKLAIVIALFFIFAYEQNLMGQDSSIKVTLDNVDAYASDVKTTYGTLIGISENEIQTFLSSMLIGSEEEELPSPDASVLSVSDSSLTLKWFPVPGATEYRVGYLDLNTGIAGEEILPLGDSIYTILLSEGFKMISIQTIYGEFVSNVDVIIQDVKVMKQVIFSGQIGCECPAFFNTEDLTNSWPLLEAGVDFQLRIFDKVNQQDIGLIHGLEIDNGGSVNEVHFNITCPNGGFMIQKENDTNNLHFYLDEGQEEPTYIGFFTFSPIVHFLSPDKFKMLYSTCQKSEEKGTNTLSSSKEGYRNQNEIAHIYPNPFTDRFTIEMTEDELKNSVVQLFSIDGSLVKEYSYNSQEAGDSAKKVIDASEVPPGYYNCIIRTGNEFRRIPLIKI